MAPALRWSMRREHAGVHQAVDPPEPPERRPHRALQGPGVGHVGRQQIAPVPARRSRRRAAAEAGHHLGDHDAAARRQRLAVARPIPRPAPVTKATGRSSLLAGIRAVRPGADAGKSRPRPNRRRDGARAAGEQLARLLATPAGIADWRGLRVLDLGCGDGGVGEALRRRGARVTGLDVAPGRLFRGAGLDWLELPAGWATKLASGAPPNAPARRWMARLARRPVVRAALARAVGTRPFRRLAAPAWRFLLRKSLRPGPPAAAG
jgi:SAM-dependent methyltransferase